jgi:hypothetical protein
VSDLEGFDVIAMNRVVPYPTPAELVERGFEVVIVQGNSGDLEAAVVDEPWGWASTRLREMAEAAGAAVLDDIVLDDGVLDEEGSSAANAKQGAAAWDAVVNYVLTIRFEVYEESSSWKPPLQFLWESTDDVAFRPGTCTNRAVVQYRVDVIEADADAGLVESFRLRHGTELETKNVDQTCELDPAVESGLFETAMLDSIGCLRKPIDRLLAPRGHVQAHRRSRESGQDLYLISLGRLQGMQVGESVEIRREQHAVKPSGEVQRTERVIARGVVTDKLDEESAWVALDRTGTQEEILQGDVISPVLRDGLLRSLTGPNCSEILEVR